MPCWLRSPPAGAGPPTTPAASRGRQGSTDPHGVRRRRRSPRRSPSWARGSRRPTTASRSPSASAGSSDLVAQIQQGAPADVFASADTANMDKAVADDAVAGDPEDFASQHAGDRRAPGQPGRGRRRCRTWRRPARRWWSVPPRCPAARRPRRSRRPPGSRSKPVSEEQAVTDVLTKVTSGEADAGLVYVTDVRAAGDKVRGSTFPESSSAVNTYPIAALSRQQARRARPRSSSTWSPAPRVSRCCRRRLRQALSRAATTAVGRAAPLGLRPRCRRRRCSWCCRWWRSSAGCSGATSSA